MITFAAHVSFVVRKQRQADHRGFLPGWTLERHSVHLCHRTCQPDVERDKDQANTACNRDDPCSAASTESRNAGGGSPSANEQSDRVAGGACSVHIISVGNGQSVRSELRASRRRASATLSPNDMAALPAARYVAYPPLHLRRALYFSTFPSTCKHAAFPPSFLSCLHLAATTTTSPAAQACVWTGRVCLLSHVLPPALAAVQQEWPAGTIASSPTRTTRRTCRAA